MELYFGTYTYALLISPVGRSMVVLLWLSVLLR